MQLGKVKRSEGTGNQQCVHRWIIDSIDVGHCVKCGAVKDFRVLREKELKAQSVPPERRGRRGGRRGSQERMVFGRGARES